MEEPMNQEHGHGMHSRSPTGRSEATSGSVLHSVRFYDALAWLMFFGRENQIRRETIGRAGISSGQSVLDVGCGTGTLALTAKEVVGLSGRVSGIDPAHEMIEAAKKKADRAESDVEFRVGAVEALPFPDCAFDVVLSSLMLHHLPEDVMHRGFAEMARVLKPGGTVFAVDLSTASPGLAHRLLGKLTGHNTGYTTPGNLEAAKLMLAATGFIDIASGRMKSKFLVTLKATRA
jgi:ubiquinone/menaquinone biosynthesis C-methylase UbiE